MRNLFLTSLLVLSISTISVAQNFYFGSDLSYVNEMQDCGVVYKDGGVETDPYEIFANHGTNLVRLRLWHTPSWYDTLNAGNRYCDFADVKRSIMRAKAAGMQVLLDFHLSDFWADPGRQIVPAAWGAVVGDLPVLQDSLYNYISSTLTELNNEGLLPELVQIGNETNRGIMLSPEDNNAGWQLQWPRNAALFKRAIQAVRDVETATGKDIRVALHIAGPAEAGWLMDGFWNNGVKDFDIIGLSYYWAWHKPTTIAQTGAIITTLKNKYPGKNVMIFETGYIWTTQNADGATNIINEVHPNYAPANPENQKKWLVDLSQEVINCGGEGVIYWEPAWVSSPCYTPWGQGSHQEHATFFDFSKNVLPAGGMSWPQETYAGLSAIPPSPFISPGRLNAYDLGGGLLKLEFSGFAPSDTQQVMLYDTMGKLFGNTTETTDGNGNAALEWNTTVSNFGIYYISSRSMQHKSIAIKKILLR